MSFVLGIQRNNFFIKTISIFISIYILFAAVSIMNHLHKLHEKNHKIDQQSRYFHNERMDVMIIAFGIIN